ncbi:MAG: SDR family NAD(P)-dependent oxidoreductase [Rhodospirillales bacterium]|nr:SDR family NAD(P)-dependent oxidoreductase [Rhodospirillales bacterium]
MWNWHGILITGGSSGLGEAMARALARPGVFIALTGRDAIRLAGVAEACRLQGAEIVHETVDVADRDRMADFIARMDARRPLDLVVANAGISAGTQGGAEGADQTRAIFAANVDGVVNTVMPALAAMASRKTGQVAIISSLASFRGLPGAPAYCASKAAVRVWGEALRPDWAGRGIKVNVICPGYVTTRMTAKNDFPMPFLMPAEKAARIMLAGLRRDKARIAFPWRLYAVVRLIAAIPPGLLDPILRRLPRK